MYNWYAVDNSSSRYICPEGWHVPTKDEYTVLSTFLGGTSVAGGKLKETGTEHWSNTNSVCDNASGFIARGNGLRYTSGIYGLIKRYSYTWSSTTNSNQAYYRRLKHNTTNFKEFSINKNYGFSVRCLED